MHDRIVTLPAQRLAYGSKPLEPAETRPRSNFPESTNAFCKVQSAKLKTDVTISMSSQTILAKPHLNKTSHTCQRHAEITQSHTFAALIRLSTTRHNLLTFNISQISSNNPEKLSLLANKHLWTFVSHSSLCKFPDVESRAGGEHNTTDFHTEKSLDLGQRWPAILLSPTSFDS